MACVVRIDSEPPTAADPRSPAASAPPTRTADGGRGLLHLRVQHPTAEPFSVQLLVPAVGYAAHAPGDPLEGSVVQLVTRQPARGLGASPDEPDLAPEQAAELLLRLREVLTRVAVGLRHAASHAAPPEESDSAPARFGDLEVDPDSGVVRRRGRVIKLTKVEFDLLSALLRRRGATASRAELMREVWNDRLPRRSRTLDQHIYRLRLKLEDDPARPRHLFKVSGVGYKLEP